MADREKLIELCKDLETLPCCDTYEGQADYLIAKGVTVQEWISVTERLPEMGEDVLVCGSRGGIYNAYLCRVAPNGYQVWHKRNSKSHYCMPTHWMPLPEPPKGD